jgi:hypothetical protein
VTLEEIQAELAKRHKSGRRTDSPCIDVNEINARQEGNVIPVYKSVIYLTRCRYF